MARLSTAPSTPLRRSPRRSATTQPYTIEIEFAVQVYRYHPPRRNLEFTRMQSGPLSYRTIPATFNPFVSDGLWSFTPRSGISRITTLGRKVGDIHFSMLPETDDATFYVCVPRHHDPSQLRWVEAMRGSHHPLYPTHVLFQRGRSAPRWILHDTYGSYVRRHDGRFSVYNQ